MISSPTSISPAQALGEALAHIERAHQLLLALPPSEGAALSGARTRIMEAAAQVQERMKLHPRGGVPAVVTK